jgi:predicted ATPase/signal transduction histidine kinase/tRNA A-37 threonylcarbamoyl transferase component Bud32
MLTLLPGYQIDSLVQESADSFIYRGYRELDAQPIILKVLKPDYCTPIELARYQREYSIIRHLNFEGVIQAYKLEQYQKTLVLILEDFSGKPLSFWIEKKQVALSDFLKIAIQTTEVLGRVHELSIIHQNINPANILFDPTSGKIKLIDFGMALEMSRESLPVQTTRGFEENLAYISPEQTGRMNRVLDYRTDFYSLGVTFYELVVGHPPFESLDPMELIHSHIALIPKSPHHMDSNIPKSVSDIIMKMLEKAAENRYQSAWGIEADLVLCLMQFEATGIIEDIVPGENDIMRNFKVSHKFYGRERESDRLLAAFDRLLSRSKNYIVDQNLLDINKTEHDSIFSLQPSNSTLPNSTMEIILIEGEEGIGKSALVAEIHKTVSQTKAYFISGQFKPNRSDRPVDALVIAFQDFLKQLLTESEDQLAIWKSRFLKTIGNRQKIVIEAIPELKLILGESVSNSESRSCKSCLKKMLQDLMFEICRSQYPIVLFLDNFQWIDLDFVNFIEQLIGNNQFPNILVIGAFRSGNNQENHFKKMIVDRIQKQGCKINFINLDPLDIEPVSHLIADTLYADLASVKSLTQITLEKTQGNPFYIHQFLTRAYTEKALLFDNQSLSWQWDIQKIENIEIADNVVRSTISKFESLLPETKSILEQASCLGLSFDLNLILKLHHGSKALILRSIEEAVSNQIIVSNKLTDSIRDEVDFNRENNYRFIDNKILENINNRLDEDTKKSIRLTIGKGLIELCPNIENAHIDSVFKIADHCNYSSDIVIDLEEKLKIAAVNLEAAKRAKALMKYDLARSYAIAGISIVPEEIWTARQDLAFNLHKERAEIEYLKGNMEGSKILVEHLIDRATSVLEKAEFENILISQYTLTSQYDQAIKIGIKALHFLGVDLSKHDLASELKKEAETLKIQLSKLEFEKLKTYPCLSDPKLEMVMKLLHSLAASTAFVDRTLFSLTIVKMVNLSISYGYVPETAIAYAAYGMLEATMFNNANLGYEFAILGIELSEKIGTAAYKCQVLMRLGVNIAPWTKSIEISLKIIEKGIHAGLEANDFQFSGYSFAYKVLFWLYSGKNLKDLLFELLQVSDFCRKHKIHWSSELIESARIPIFNLCGKTVSSLNFTTESWSETDYIKNCQERQNWSALACYYTYKSQVLYLYGEYELALQCVHQAEAFLDSIWSTITLVEHQFYYALSLAALYPSVSSSQQTEYWQILEAIQSQMLRWTDNCPANFQHRYLLVSAEMAGMTGQDLEAIDLYDQAIECTREQAWVYGEALANERAAVFWLHRGNPKIAKVYLQDAYRSYQQWGAVRKVENLEQKYAYLLASCIPSADRSPMPNRALSSAISLNSNGSRSRALDLATVTKASQVLSGEIEIGHLLDKLMQMAIANAGATSGFLILVREEGLMIEAEKMAGSEDINVRQAIPIQDSDRLPLSIVNYVARTHESVVANDAIHESAFASDAYIQRAKPKSILCAPIQGQGKLIGIVYLENNLATSAFTRDRLDVLMLLCAQGAIALENSRLYENLQISQLQMIQGEKMATLGQLVAGVAHEINNPVGFIAANISHAKGYFEDLISLIELYQEIYPDADPKIEEEIEMIDLEFLLEDLPKILDSMDLGTNRIRQISKSLRTFSRNDESAKVAVNLHDGIDSTLMILKHRLKANNERPEIEIIREYGNLPDIKCFAGQLNQVFMNLLANAIDALEDSNQGRTYADIEKNPNTIRITTEVQESRNTVIISIADNGQGMTEDIKQKVFDHLFTTKPVGKGTGLGLSISRQIVVEKHRGQLSCQSNLGQGTKFTIEIPTS